MTGLCQRVGMSRQNFYKKRKYRRRRKVDECQILELVKEERKVQPRIGVRKLHKTLQSKFEEVDVSIGRDCLFELLAQEGLLVPPLPKAPRTTDSRHSLPVFQNEVREMAVNNPNEIWVGDLTYVRTLEGFSYLAVIMDRFSRKIVGYYCGQSLATETCLQALEQALGNLSKKSNPMHHSDRGCQYCSHKYVNRLQASGLGISMTEENHCYENAHAERVIGILKQEYGLGLQFRSHEQLVRAVDQAILLYNHRRLHKSLGYRTPNEVHNQVA